MIAVFDTNIWLSQLGMRSGAAAAAKFFLNHNGARLALPEVVRLEVEHNLEAQLLGHIKTIEDSYRQLLGTFGTLREVVLPSTEDVQRKIQELFESIDVPKVAIPFSAASARSSFLKTIKKAPPSDKTQEFKDGVLWADCLALLATEDVTLVTSDKAFYRDRQYDKGLAANLVAEAAQHPNRIQIAPTLSAFMQTLSTTVPLNEDMLGNAVLSSYATSVDDIISRNGFTLGPRIRASSQLFATENSTELFLEYSISYACNDVRGEDRGDAELLLTGDCMYSPATESFSVIRSTGESLKYRMADGSEKENRNVYAFGAGLVSGHREVSSQVRYRLDDAR